MRNLSFILPLIFSLPLFSQQTTTPVSAEQQLADSLYQSNNYIKALPLYEKIVKQSPENPVTWNRLGYCYHTVGKYAEAIHCYELSLQHKPGAGLKQVVESRLARIYSLKKDTLKSLQWINQAITSGYNNLPELETNTEFAFLRKSPAYKVLHDTLYNRAFTCMTDSNSRKFDFWVGEWDAYQNGTNNLAGYSKIEIASGGCMILENWTSAIGSFSGKSMNYYIPEKGKWEQVWVGSEGSPQRPNRFSDGEYKDGAMRFTFSGSDQKGKFTGHFFFYNLGPDKVRQFNEQSYDDGKTWETQYDFVYIRKKKIVK